MKLKLTKYENAPEFGTWGEWTLGKEHGTFGCSIKGMWATLDGARFIGLETYEQNVTEDFKNTIVRWRQLNARWRKCNKLAKAL